MCEYLKTCDRDFGDSSERAASTSGMIRIVRSTIHFECFQGAFFSAVVKTGEESGRIKIAASVPRTGEQSIPGKKDVRGHQSVPRTGE